MSSSKKSKSSKSSSSSNGIDSSSKNDKNYHYDSFSFGGKRIIGSFEASNLLLAIL